MLILTKYMINLNIIINLQWLHLFKNGTLNYAYIIKEQRSNSFIENYNRRIKTVLSKY